MAKKTNKTEHVLKMISKEENPEGTEVEEAREALQQEGTKEAPDSNVEGLSEEAGMSVENEEKIRIACQREQSPEDNTQLINLAEQLVMENIHEVMERMNVCTCPICTNDIAALALNMLPQKYITTNKGKQYTQINIYKKQYETDVLAAITKACVRVKAGPRHG